MLIPNASLHAYVAYGDEGGYWFANALKFGNSFGAQLVLDVLVAGLALLTAVLMRHRWPRYGLTPWAVCLVIGSLGVIAISTLTRRAGATSPGYLQVQPFGTMRNYLNDPADFLIYLGGNIAMFVPLGLFLYLAVRRHVLLCAVAATGVSAGVEILQLPIYSRSSDIDDVITNGFGGLIGALLGMLLVRACRTGRLGGWAQQLIGDAGERTLTPPEPPRPAGLGTLQPVPGEIWPSLYRPHETDGLPYQTQNLTQGSGQNLGQWPRAGWQEQDRSQDQSQWPEPGHRPGPGHRREPAPGQDLRRKPWQEPERRPETGGGHREPADRPDSQSPPTRPNPRAPLRTLR